MKYLALKRLSHIFISTFLIAAFTVTSLSGCASGEASKAPDDRLEIVTTIFPEYDWVNNIIGENPGNAEVTLLLKNGVDLHSYQPTTADILKISGCDLFIYVGGESDGWVEDVVSQPVNKDMIAINLMEVLSDTIREEETVEGMQEEEEEEEGEIEYDEHVWLSLKNAKICSEEISKAIQTLDAQNANVYKANTDEYIGKLDDLDEQFRSTIEAAPLKTLLFGDRFPFRYMTDEYGLSYYAAFAGCSAETEASFETVTFLSQKMDELSLPVILTIDGSDKKLAETIIGNTKAKNQKILTLDSMQSVRDEDIDSGTTYLSVMEGDLSILKEALGQ